MGTLRRQEAEYAVLVAASLSHTVHGFSEKRSKQRILVKNSRWRPDENFQVQFLTRNRRLTCFEGPMELEAVLIEMLMHFNSGNTVQGPIFLKLFESTAKRVLPV